MVISIKTTSQVGQKLCVVNCVIHRIVHRIVVDQVWISGVHGVRRRGWGYVLLPFLRLGFFRHLGFHSLAFRDLGVRHEGFVEGAVQSAGYLYLMYVPYVFFARASSAKPLVTYRAFERPDVKVPGPVGCQMRLPLESHAANIAEIIPLLVVFDFDVLFDFVRPYESLPADETDVVFLVFGPNRSIQIMCGRHV